MEGVPRLHGACSLQPPSITSATLHGLHRGMPPALRACVRSGCVKAPSQRAPACALAAQLDEESLFIDAADREHLMRMTELEREMILADRAEERDKARQRKELLESTREADESRDKVGAVGAVGAVGVREDWDKVGAVGVRGDWDKVGGVGDKVDAVRDKVGALGMREGRRAHLGDGMAGSCAASLCLMRGRSRRTLDKKKHGR